MLTVILFIVGFIVGCLVGSIAMDYAYYKKFNHNDKTYVDYVKEWFRRKF